MTLTLEAAPASSVGIPRGASPRNYEFGNPLGQLAQPVGDQRGRRDNQGITNAARCNKIPHCSGRLDRLPKPHVIGKQETSRTEQTRYACSLKSIQGKRRWMHQVGEAQPSGKNSTTRCSEMQRNTETSALQLPAQSGIGVQRSLCGEG